MTRKNIFSTSLILILLTVGAYAYAEKQAATDADKKPQEKQYGSVEERRIMESLQGEASSPLAKEREDLENKKKELKRLESEVDKKLEQLNQLRVRIEQLMAEKDAKEVKRVQELAKMYEKMSPDKAASLLTTVDQDLAIAILAKMKIKSAAKILNNIDREKAAKLSTAFSTLNP